jgi:hypothetical protein
MEVALVGADAAKRLQGAVASSFNALPLPWHPQKLWQCAHGCGFQSQDFNDVAVHERLAHEVKNVEGLAQMAVMRARNAQSESFDDIKSKPGIKIQKEVRRLEAQLHPAKCTCAPCARSRTYTPSSDWLGNVAGLVLGAQTEGTCYFCGKTNEHHYVLNHGSGKIERFCYREGFRHHLGLRRLQTQEEGQTVHAGKHRRAEVSVDHTNLFRAQTALGLKEQRMWALEKERRALVRELQHLFEVKAEFGNSDAIQRKIEDVRWIIGGPFCSTHLTLHTTSHL